MALKAKHFTKRPSGGGAFGYRVYTDVLMNDGQTHQVLQFIKAADDADMATQLAKREATIKTKYDDQMARDEYAKALDDVFAGVDVDVQFDAGAYPHLTRNDVRRKCLRKIANELEDVNRNNIGELANTSAWVSTLTNDTIARLLSKSGGAQWTNSEANTLVKQKLAALMAEVGSMPHGKGKVDEDNE